jgi:hypothetical protein
LPEDFLLEISLIFFADLQVTLADPGVLLTRLPASAEAGADRGDFVVRGLLGFLKAEPKDSSPEERRYGTFDPDRSERFSFLRTATDAPDASISGADSTAG